MVTDFFQVSSFYIFNVADCCITVGVALLVLDQVIQWWKHRRIHIAP
jgi:lipoprotein signal peptidase